MQFSFCFHYPHYSEEKFRVTATATQQPNDVDDSATYSADAALRPTAAAEAIPGLAIAATASSSISEASSGAAPASDATVLQLASHATRSDHALVAATPGASARV